MRGRISSGASWLIICAFAGVAACLDMPSSAESVGAATVAENVVVHSGNDQTGPAGEPLPAVLALRVADDVGRPHAGTRVQWTVTSGDASVDPSSSVSDALGVARATVTLGDAADAVEVEAEAEGVGKVAFTATSDASCAMAPLVIGEPVHGALTEEDCRRDTGARTHRFRLDVDATGSLRLTQTSSAFATQLLVSDPMGEYVAGSDNEEPSEGNAVQSEGNAAQSEGNAALRLFLAPGAYVVSASGVDQAHTGEYTLDAAVDDSDVTGCQLFDTWVVRGVTLEQNLAVDDCALSDASATTYYGDPYLIHLAAGASLNVIQTSADVDTYLEVYGLTPDGFVFLGFNDNAGQGSTDSSYTFVAPASTVYMMLPSSARGWETGAYTLAIE